MTSDILYGRNTLSPYFDLQRFEDSIYNRASIRETRIKKRRKLRIVDSILTAIACLLFVSLIVAFALIMTKSIMIKKRTDYIKKLETTLEKKEYENQRMTLSLKSNMRFDELKMKAYMELNMITPTEKNIIYFDKSDNGFVRQYENIR